MDTKLVQSRLGKLEKLKNFPFVSLKKLAGAEERLETLAGDILVEIGMHIEIMLECFPTFWDKALPRRRCGYVTGATRNAWNEVLKTQFLGANDIKKDLPKQLAETIKNRMTSKREEWRKYTAETYQAGPNWGYIMKKNKAHKSSKKDVLAAYIHPPVIGDAVTDSSTLAPKVVSKQSFESMTKPHKPNNVVEYRYLFKTNEDRFRQVNNFQQELGCNQNDAALKRLPLFPDKPDPSVSDPNNNGSSSSKID